MDKRGIELLIRDTTPNHKSYKEFRGISLPITERHAATSVRLPIYPELKDEEVDYIVKSIRGFYKK